MRYFTNNTQSVATLSENEVPFRKSDFYMILNTKDDKRILQFKLDTTNNLEKETWKSVYNARFKLFISTVLQ